MPRFISDSKIVRRASGFKAELLDADSHWSRLPDEEELPETVTDEPSLRSLNKAQLVAYAQDHSVELEDPQGMTKAEIRSAIEDAMADPEEDDYESEDELESDEDEVED